MSAKLIINRGLPGARKTTWTRTIVENDYENVIRVNRDDIRKMLHDSVYIDGVTEKNVILVRDAIIRAGLKAGKVVVSDDTNLSSHVVKGLAKIAAFFGARVEVNDFDVPVDVCIESDSKRSGVAHVGEEVIRGMVKRYFAKGKFPENPLENIVQGVTFAPYVPDPTRPYAVIFDIDGTVADHQGVRSPYDYTKVLLDNPRHGVIEMVEMHRERGYEIIFLSGRDSICFDDTVTWINKHINIGGQFNLWMRPEGDVRQDRIIKGELFDKYVRNYFDVKRVYDDRTQVVRLWRDELQLDCYQVNWGNF